MKEARLRDYLHKKATGQLLITKLQKTLGAALAEVPLSYSADGFIHIGDHVMIFSVETEGVVSVDVADDTRTPESGLMATTSTVTQGHVARNTFVIEGAPARLGARVPEPGSVLRYGEVFRIRLHPSLCGGKPIYLASQPVSLLSASKISRHQEVTFKSSAGHDTLWVAAHKDPAQRFESEGQPVPAMSEVLIQHNQTRQALSSEKKNVFNDFGCEYELCAHTFTAITKNGGLYQELMGKTTVDTPVRREGTPNMFAFLTAAAAPEETKAEAKDDVAEGFDGGAASGAGAMGHSGAVTSGGDDSGAVAGSPAPAPGPGGRHSRRS